MGDPLVAVLATVLAVALSAGAFWYGRRHFDRFLSPVDRDQFKLLDEAVRMERVDPAVAERLLEDHFRSKAEIDGGERDRLRARAPTDRRAAEELRERLLDDLAANVGARKDFERRATADPNAQAAALAIDADTAKLREEIAHLEHLLGASAT